MCVCFIVSEYVGFCLSFQHFNLNKSIDSPTGNVLFSVLLGQIMWVCVDVLYCGSTAVCVDVCGALAFV